MSMICLLCKENETNDTTIESGQKVCDQCHDNSCDFLERNAEKIALMEPMFDAIRALVAARHISSESMRRASYSKEVQKVFDAVEELAKSEKK